MVRTRRAKCGVPRRGSSRRSAIALQRRAQPTDVLRLVHHAETRTADAPSSRSGALRRPNEARQFGHLLEPRADARERAEWFHRTIGEDYRPEALPLPLAGRRVVPSPSTKVSTEVITEPTICRLRAFSGAVHSFEIPLHFPPARRISSSGPATASSDGDVPDMTARKRRQIPRRYQVGGRGARVRRGSSRWD